jgi:cellulose biosynthesis protein BcsQ
VTTILITMYDARTKLAAGVAAEVREHFGGQVLQDRDPALGAGLRGAQLRPERDDLRSRIAGSPELSRSRHVSWPVVAPAPTSEETMNQPHPASWESAAASAR